VPGNDPVNPEAVEEETNAAMLYAALESVYREYWSGFSDWLRPRLSADGKMPGMSPPLLLGPPGAYSRQPTRLLVFGQQTETWYNGRFLAADPAEVIGIYMRIYRDEFRLGAVRAWTPFWQAVRRLEQSLGIEPCSSLWNNLNKVDYIPEGGGKAGRPTPYIEAVVSRRFPVIPREVELVRPHVVIFFTGTSRRQDYDYDRLLEQIFVGAELDPVDPPVTGSVPIARVIHPALPERSFRTQHPGQFRRSGAWDSTLDALARVVAM
jgi:hypothetical protein